MMKYSKIILLSSVVFLMSLTLGPGPGVGETSWIIDGDGLVNQKCVLEIKTNDFKSNFYAKGGFNVTQDGKNMSIYISGKNNIDKNLPYSGIKMIFNAFDSVGTYNIEDSTLHFTIFSKKETIYEEFDKLYVVDGPGKIIISKFGKVGGLIEGTFSGQFARLDFDTKAGVYVDNDVAEKITEGKFSVVRYPDTHWNKPPSTGDEPPDYKKNKKTE